MNPKARARVRLLLLAAVFAAPVVFSYALYYSGWRPEEIRTHGDLVTPSRRVADVELKSLDGAAMRLTTSPPPRWSLVYFGSSECGSACERALYVMRQVIAAQGREAHRVRPVMIVTDKRAIDRLRSQLKEYPTIVPLTGSKAEIARLAGEFEMPEGGALSGLHRLYVVDPLGNLVISYPAQIDPSGISKDLKRLLRYSQIG
jgi:cytochrome oxidase Cu insertion factor (SCO1/SenC/PrrC family)